MNHLLLIAGAGALGALSRYGVSLWALRVLGSRLPWGTLLVNVVGCLLLGFLLEASALLPLSKEARLALGTGFLGSFTTFSTFGVETLALVEAGDWPGALLNVGLNLVVGLICAAAGVFLARTLWG